MAYTGIHKPFHIESIPTLLAHTKSSLKSTIKEIEQNIEISGVSQITFSYDNGEGHTLEVFHTYEDIVYDPNDSKKKVKAKIMCTIDSEDSVCFLQASKEYAPCEEKSYGTNHASKNSPI